MFIHEKRMTLKKGSAFSIEKRSAQPTAKQAALGVALALRSAGVQAFPACVEGTCGSVARGFGTWLQRYRVSKALASCTILSRNPSSLFLCFFLFYARASDSDSC